MEVDDSGQVLDHQPPRQLNNTRGAATGIGLAIWSLVTSPLSITFNLFASLFHFIFRVLRIPYPARFGLLSNGINRSARRGSYSDDPAVVAERWIRELEEETGALCVSKVQALEANGRDQPGPSNHLVHRGTAGKRKALPDFFSSGYDAALKVAQTEARVLCVIITCEEHDDVAAFRKDVLTDPELVRTLADNNIIVWGGDVRDRDGYQGQQVCRCMPSENADSLIF